MSKNKKKPLTNVSPFDQALLSWQAPEYFEPQRGKLWFIVAGITLFTVLFFSLYYQSWTFTLAIIASGLAYFSVHSKKPRKIEIKLSEMGLKVGQRIYPYDKIDSFWFFYHPPYFQELIIKVKDDFLVEIPIQLGKQDPAVLRNFLLLRLPEKVDKKEGLFNLFIRLLKI